MVVYCVFVVLICVYAIYTIAKRHEIVSNNRVEEIEKEKKRLRYRKSCLIVFVAITIYGITRESIIGLIFFTFIGAVGAISSLSEVLRKAGATNKLIKMSDEEYVDYQNKLIDEDIKENGEKSQFLIDPPCPQCGSKDVRTSDNYRIKAAARSAGSMILGQVLGNYTNFNTAQTYYLKQQFKNSIKIEKEYQCRHCGHVWKGEPIVQYKHVDSKSSRASKDPLPEQLSDNNMMQGLIDLYQAGVLTREELDHEMKRIHPVESSVSNVASSRQKSLKEKIDNLRELLEAGALTHEEFDAEMNKLLLS